MAHDFEQLKERIYKQYKSEIKELEKINLFTQVLAPCIFAAPLQENTSKALSKVGGFPSVPPGYEVPTWNNQKLVFLCQISFSELNEYDTASRLPDKGLLSIFAYMKNEKGALTIPEMEQSQLLGFYFEETESLRTLADAEILLPQAKEVFLSFGSYADLPEFGDYRLPEKYIKIDPDFKYTWDVIPKTFGLTETPSMKILGYPTDDAMNSYYSWYLKDNGLSYQDKIDESQLKTEMKEYELLLWISLTEIGSLQLADEYAEFGGISIGIRRKDLAAKNFKRLLFKYTIS